MKSSEEINATHILQHVRIGLWRIEVTEGEVPCFYADQTMDELLGIHEAMSPQERFAFHRAHIHPEDMAMFQEYSDKLAEVQTEIVYRYIHPMSGEMIVRCAGCRDTAVTDRVSIVGTHQDISDTVRLEKEKAAERRLAEINTTLRKERKMQDAYYRELLDMQSCGVMAYTLPGHRMIHMNAKALRMYGAESIEQIQQSLGEFLRDIEYPESSTVERLKRLRDMDDTVDYECIIGKGKPNECHALAKTKVVRIPSGERAVLTTFLDVSDMVVLKDALRQAEEGSRAKSAFLFAMSHDLRTPMNAIIGYAELMETHWGDRERTEKYLQKLKVAGYFLLDLIGNVLELSRIESGKETLNESPWDLGRIPDTLNTILDSQIGGKKLTVNWDVQIRHTAVYCDVLKLREIMMNLMSNAVKYTPEGGRIDLKILEIPCEKDGCAAFTMTVEDTGKGISEEYLPHIFEAFTRENHSADGGIMGTGLGLRIVKNFVDLMHGRIEVDSQPGKGSRFTVTLCLKIANEEKIAEQTEAPGIVTVQNRRFLLAEDNPLNAEITMAVLTDAGARVELAKDGAIAVQMLKDADCGYYDLILMDIQMPHMNGYEATRQIRKLPDERAKIPIIAMTANAFEEDRQAAFASGMDGYLDKPVRIARLLQTISQILKQR